MCLFFVCYGNILIIKSFLINFSYVLKGIFYTWLLFYELLSKDYWRNKKLNTKNILTSYEINVYTVYIKYIQYIHEKR